jgi:cytochrome c oxidase subunit 2
VNLKIVRIPEAVSDLLIENGMKHAATYTVLTVITVLLAACGGSNKSNPDLQARGEELFANYICNTCHSLDGSEMYGPTLKDIIGKEVTVIRDGEEHRVTVDRKYLKKSIQDPDFEKLKGFEARIMPKPQISKDEVKLLVEYLMTLDQ